jgi:RimJ/RimL family protein N-acetyltransferase
VDFALDVASFEPTPYTGLAAELQAKGIEIQSFAQLKHDPDRLMKLYELDWALWQDIPYFGQVVTKRSFAQFVADMVDSPTFLPAACFIAVKKGEFIGYSNLSETGEGLNTEMTGVLRSERGQGVATLLKLSTIRYTQEQGVQRLWTVNDAVNTGIIALNQKFGFQQTGAMIRFSKKSG